MFEQYQSPYSWRYGTTEMRSLWGEIHLRKLWRTLWVKLAAVQAEFGLVKTNQVEDLKRHAGNIQMENSHKVESEIHHDLMAELHVFSEQCKIGGGIIHLGATSMDIKDNAEVLRIKEALAHTLKNLENLLRVLSKLITKWADTPIIAFTHLQPAEPTTLGYRLAQYGQDLLIDWKHLKNVYINIKGRGFRGAVGTGAAFAELIGEDRMPEFEEKLSESMGLPLFSIVSQTYPRKQDYEVITALAGMGGSLYKFAFDLRILQSPPFGEISEPFGEKQVGSSAMPFKRNPIMAEKIDSLARYLAQLPRLAWDNAAHSLLERTLDDSANRRTMLPEAFLIVDELLQVSERIFKDLRVDERAIKRNLEKYGVFAGTEKILIAAVKAGADRQKMHGRLRDHSIKAWEEIQNGEDNPLIGLIKDDEDLAKYLSKGEIDSLMTVEEYVGDAPQRATKFAKDISRELDQGHK